MKEKIIHWLGGYTKQEFEDACAFNYSVGEDNAIDGLIRFAKAINGCSAEEWCNQMWQTLIDKRNKNK